MAGTSLETEEYPLVSKTQNYLFQIFLMVFDGSNPLELSKSVFITLTL